MFVVSINQIRVIPAHKPKKEDDALHEMIKH